MQKTLCAESGLILVSRNDPHDAVTVITSRRYW